MCIIFVVICQDARNSPRRDRPFNGVMQAVSTTQKECLGLSGALSFSVSDQFEQTGHEFFRLGDVGRAIRR